MGSENWNKDDSLWSTQPEEKLTFWQATLNDVKSCHTNLDFTLQNDEDIDSQGVDQSGKYSHKSGYTSPSVGMQCQLPFINHHRNDQPFSVIPVYYSQLFQGMAFLKASGDNDNVSNVRKPCNRIWLRAAQHCQAVCLSGRMESDAKSVRQQLEVLFHRLGNSDWRLYLFFL